MTTKEMKDLNDDFNEKLPLAKLLPLGLQHIVTMVGSFMVPIIVGTAIGIEAKDLAYLVSAILLSSGIAILIQVIGFGKSVGSKLPIVMGSSFITLGPMIIVGQQYGVQALFGSIIGSGLFIILISFFLDKILLLFPKVVTGSFITIMGITLAPVAFENFAGGEGAANFGSPKNMILGLIVLVIVISLHKLGKGFVKTMSVLLGVIAGTIIAGFMGMIDVSPVASANWVQVVTPFHFGMPEFNLSAIFTMSIFCVINLIQCVGAYSVLDQACGGQTSNKVIISGLRGQAVAQVISGMFNSVPHAFLNENISVMVLSGVKSRFVSITTGCILVVLSFLPKFAAIVTIIPAAVRGGALIAIFGMVIAAGISILSKLNFSENHNNLIIGTSIAIGIGSSYTHGVYDKMPWMIKMLFGNGLFSASVAAILLNVCLNFHTIKQTSNQKTKELKHAS